MGTSDQGTDTAARRLLFRQVGRSLRALGSDLDRLDEAVAARAGLHRTDLRCLEIAARGGGISAGTLAAEAGLSTSAVTSVIDRVERIGYLRRARDGADRRRVLVEVTDLGRRTGQAAFAGLAEGTQRVLERYSAAELRLLGEFVERIRAVLVAEAAKAAAGAAGNDSPEVGQ